MEAGNHSGTNKIGIARQFHESDEPGGMVNHTDILPATARESSDLPMFQVLADESVLEENEESLLLAFARNEAPEARIPDIVPNFYPTTHHAMRRLPVLTRGIDKMRTRHKRVLPDGIPLTKEHGLQCLAEESLTLFRHGIRSPPSMRPDTLRLAAEQVGVGRGGAEGGTWRRGKNP